MLGASIVQERGGLCYQNPDEAVLSEHQYDFCPPSKEHIMSKDISIVWKLSNTSNNRIGL
jgi:hypothetical protein